MAVSTLVRIGMLLAASAAAWGVLAWMAFDMGHPLVQLTMPGWPYWSVANAAAVFLMWAIMMAAMMLPSALPVILVFIDLSRRQGEHGRALAFVAAYLAVWSVFSAAATMLQWTLQAIDLVDPMIVSTSAGLNAGLLLLAGAYQFSPLKKACLAYCRTPMGFLIGDWRPGLRGAFAMGVRHGVYCTGCCWALMALLFVGGVMNLAWIAALAVAVAVEKMAPRGELVGALIGALLLAAGTYRMATLLVHP